MAKMIDLTGQVFGRYKVISFYARTPVRWNCICLCGNKRVVRSGNLKAGISKSCGCLSREKIIKYNTKHNLCNKHPLYGVWKNIKQRCLNPNNPRFDYYGGRGVSICNQWVQDFISFYTWSLANGWEDGLQIDRIDNNGNYGPSNCRFTTNQINSTNRRDSHNIKVYNQTLNRSEIARKFNIPYGKLRHRLGKGQDVHQILRELSNVTL